MSTAAQAAIPLPVGSRVLIHDSASRFNGEVGVVAAIYRGAYSSHLVQLADGWSAVFPVGCLEEANP